MLREHVSADEGRPFLSVDVRDTDQTDIDTVSHEDGVPAEARLAEAVEPSAVLVLGDDAADAKPPPRLDLVAVR